MMADGARLTWAILSSRFQLEATPDPRLDAGLYHLMAGFRTGAGKPAAPSGIERVRVQGWTGEPGWVSFHGEDGVTRRRALDPVGAASVEHAIISRAVERERHMVVLHAASVHHAGSAALLLGHSGAGKTTLALLLRRAGLGLLSDDLSPVDPLTARLCAFPRSIHLDGEYGPEIRASLPSLPPGLSADRVPFPPPVPVTAGGGAPGTDPNAAPREGSHAIRLVLVLGRSDPGDDRTEALSSAEVVQLLLRSVIRGEGSGLSTLLRPLIRVARGARGHRMLTSSPERALGAALELLAAPARGAQRDSARPDRE